MTQMLENPVGLFESATWKFSNADRSEESPPVPYFDMTTVTAASLIVRNSSTGEEKTFSLQILDQFSIEGGSEIQVRYVPIANDLPKVGTYVARVRLTNPDGQSESEAFMINVVPRDVA